MLQKMWKILYSNMEKNVPTGSSNTLVLQQLYLFWCFSSKNFHKLEASQNEPGQPELERPRVLCCMSPTCASCNIWFCNTVRYCSSKMYLCICIAHFNNRVIQCALHKTLKGSKQNVKATQGNLKTFECN